MLRQRLEFHRDEALTRLAKDQPCMVPWKGYRFHDPRTVVWCHSNMSLHGKGKSVKAHDCFGFFGCMLCHHDIDQGAGLLASERTTLTMEAMKNTRRYLTDHELIEGVTSVEVLRLTDAEWLQAWLDGTIRVRR
jgi:hypothetical protein